MNETKSTIKGLKKQMAAAVAMVTVAAVALGSSTYAWFVTNSQVQATTAKIGAQSNSAYLLINTTATTTSGTTSSVVSNSPSGTTNLYPAEWKNTYNTSGGTDGTLAYQFETAFASAANAATEKDGTRKLVGDPEKANTDGYALLQSFNIGTGNYDGKFTNLRITGVTVNADNNTSGNTSELKSAMRVLVVCDSNWSLWKEGTSALNGSISGKTDTIFAGTFGKNATGSGEKSGDVNVKAYVFYDGSDQNVYSDNITDLAGCGVTITFVADPVNPSSSN